MSLTARLSLIASLLFLAGMIAGVSFLIANARQRVADEVESTATLTYQLLDTLLATASDTLVPADRDALLGRLLAVENARHMTILIETGGVPVASPGSTMTADAPGWFVRRVMPAPLEFRRPLGVSGDVIVIRTSPADEISEVWQESRNLMGVLLLVLLLLNGVLYLTIGRWFRPVETIIRGLEDVEKGDYSGHIRSASLPELKSIVEKLNHLTGVLRESKAENDRLARHSLSIQETERRHLARELHDELGQSISAIKAIAFSIADRTAGRDEMSAEGAGRISAISDDVRGHIRGMMRRLRPAVMDKLGLAPALEQMVDEWNDTHKDCFCSLRLSGNLAMVDEITSINVYRIVQESLTNTASHARAGNVDISLKMNGTLHLAVTDNGRGFDPDTTVFGMGLAGIRERVNALGGKLAVTTAPGQGVSITISIPVAQRSET